MSLYKSNKIAKQILCKLNATPLTLRFNTIQKTEKCPLHRTQKLISMFPFAKKPMCYLKLSKYKLS
ncbi:hypothetical protein A3Q56_00894, partial [Intoshia linei]